MFRYAIKLLVFFLPLLLLLAFVEYKARQSSVPNNYTAKRAIIEQNIGTTQVFISGSSHAYYGILAKRLGVGPVPHVVFSDGSKNLGYLASADLGKRLSTVKPAF